MPKKKTRHAASQVVAWANVCGEVRDAKTGELVKVVRKRNKVTAAGLALFAALMVGDSTATITHVGYGTGTTAASASDTAMETEVGRGAYTSRTSAAGVLTVTFYLASGDGNGSTLSEVGLLTANSGGTLVARAVLGNPIVKTSSVTVTFTWTVTLAAA